MIIIAEHSRAFGHGLFWRGEGGGTFENRSRTLKHLPTCLFNIIETKIRTKQRWNLSLQLIIQVGISGFHRSSGGIYHSAIRRDVRTAVVAERVIRLDRTNGREPRVRDSNNNRLRRSIHLEATRKRISITRRYSPVL